ncbi:hypothetical protein [uncultured Roseobacter sp.]|uniref:hypothetical protein n=1 Tax=uncultured Roseobacter sp. TaxID=114847 RepID=UPI00262A5BA2|nr:hypothetical protein [uncultured Roseobacter sp.]
MAQGATEELVWNTLTTIARELDQQFTYKAAPIPGGGIFGSNVNSNSFIVSALLHAEKRLGVTLDVIEAAENPPGQFTWLGTGDADVLDMADSRARLIDGAAILGSMSASQTFIGIGTIQAGSMPSILRACMAVATGRSY